MSTLKRFLVKLLNGDVEIVNGLYIYSLGDAYIVHNDITGDHIYAKKDVSFIKGVNG